MSLPFRITLLLFCCALQVLAGFCSPKSAPPETRHDFQFFAGYSPVSTTLIGTTTDRRMLVGGMDYSYRCWASTNVSVSYTGGVMPAAVLFEPGQYLPQFVPAHAVYGVAVTPLGFTVDFARRHRIYPFLETDGGIVASTEPIPINVPGATGLNFMFDLGGGIRIRTGERRAVTLGYRYLHISNAFTTPVNPGVDNNVLYFGFSFLR
jgi:hypothetical protein